MTDAPLFSIFIPTWNNLPFLKLCVESIRRNSAYRHEILVFVNDGSDGTLEWVREQGLKYRHSPHNVGVCWAMNALRPLMSTEYVAFVNDDMYMLPGWDKPLWESISRCGGNRRWFFASTIIEPDARDRSYISADFGRTPEEFSEQALLEAAPSFNRADWHGASKPPTVVHRDMWDLVGGYSIEYSPGLGSDPDFNAKLWLAGVRDFIGIGSSLVYHFKSVSVDRVVKNDGNIQFLRKWGLTIRAFRQTMLNTDEPASEPLRTDSRKLRNEKLRSAIKKLLTVWKNPDAPTLWDSKPGDITASVDKK
ncbi:glycosyltransferase family 2 protein [uncultured Duncaniella sp.]|uniref:glycosyltransferase family 2 protein n=1 Tax=uncultured Duncaniella sp. TaxID=2768039 RepID=UPI00265AF055|nr:glycosyltransferase family 2 protein [uncultured Duncaniella sp.]